MTPAPSQHRRCGFTLIELIVALGVIVVLMGFMMSAVPRVRRQARITECASNLRQITTAMTTYAADNDGQYPTLDTAATGGNLWDVPITFYDALVRQGVPHRFFFCPAAQDDSIPLTNFKYYGYFYIINYNVWVPRKNGSDVIPPANTYTGGRFQIVQPPPATPFAGPARMSDRLAATNPLITDIAGSSGATPTASANAGQSGNPYAFLKTANHQENQRMLGLNQGFADGHVEFHFARDVKPYYFGNWWNWR